MGWQRTVLILAICVFVLFLFSAICVAIYFVWRYKKKSKKEIGGQENKGIEDSIPMLNKTKVKNREDSSKTSVAGHPPFQNGGNKSGSLVTGEDGPKMGETVASVYRNHSMDMNGRHMPQGIVAV